MQHFYQNRHFKFKPVWHWTRCYRFRIQDIFGKREQAPNLCIYTTPPSLFKTCTFVPTKIWKRYSLTQAPKSTGNAPKSVSSASRGIVLSFLGCMLCGEKGIFSDLSRSSAVLDVTRCLLLARVVAYLGRGGTLLDSVSPFGTLLALSHQMLANLLK